VPVAFNMVHMITPLVGWAVGGPPPAPNSGMLIVQPGGVFRTTDGGRVWQDVTPAAATLNGQSQAYFLDSQQAWLAAALLSPSDTSALITMYHTSDGGQTWQASTPFSTEDGWPVSLVFVPDQIHGWMMLTTGPGAGSEPVSIYASHDGGLTWLPVSLPGGGNHTPTPDALPTGCIKSGMAFNTTSDGWVTASCPGGPLFFYASHDGGLTWHDAMPPVPQGYQAGLFGQCMCGLSGPQFVNAQDGSVAISIFEADSQAAYLYVTHDGGKAWLPSPLPVTIPRLGPDFATPQDGWVSDGQQLYATHDGGETWKQVSSLPVQNVVGGLSFVDANNGFLTDGTMVYATHDGGASWASWQPGVSR
jgi:photosystem II stability/assembly factor-like uncharacterized protein